MHANQFSLFDEDTAPAPSLPSQQRMEPVTELQIPVGFAAFSPPPTTKETRKSSPKVAPAYRPTTTSRPTASSPRRFGCNHQAHSA
jgi:hypothetical protein